MAHYERARIGVGNEAIVLAAIDLHLILIEAVPQIMGRDAERRIETLRAVDCKRRVRQVLGLRLRHRRNDAFCRQPIPYRRQFLQNRAVAVELRVARRRYVREAVGARKRAVEVVEGPVLGVDHHDCGDILDARSADLAGPADNCRAREHGQHQNAFSHMTNSPFPRTTHRRRSQGAMQFKSLDVAVL